ncbi:centromere O [Labeo rohita]|uniref:Centromere protein O n=1 Tax=Labeo rohita TaxID=84645 RepID=A0A498NPI0_LABRO|nr:centromere O [Labeo rohita]RXN33823.1 centromere O [Labeo rohita]
MDSQMETMEQGVLGHLMALERGGMGQQDQHESQRLEVLKVKAVTLRAKRDQLKRQTDAVKAGTTVLSFSGGYDLVECKEGKSVCVSFHTAFEGVYLETYNMELDLTRTVQISRHNIPPSFPLESFAKQNLQKDLKAFLQTLSQNLNALAARRQQVYLLKELVGSVEVMESNQLCNILVLMCTAQGETPIAVLCTLEYGDLTQCLPTRVSIECEDKTLSESPQWKKNQSLLLESPAHTALLTMRRMGSIA